LLLVLQHSLLCLYGQRSQDGDNPHWHHSEILGHWNGLKVSQTERTELWVIVHEFKKKFAKAIGKVKLSSKLLFFTNYEQISAAQRDHQIVAVVKTDDPKPNLVWWGKLTERREKLDMVAVCTHTFVGA
jgi:hypothetical protein